MGTTRFGKKCLCIRGFLCAAFLLASLFADALDISAEEGKLDLYAQSAVLMDADSGRILYEKNGYTPMAMASTTKIMTCIIVLEQVSLDEKAAVSAYAASMPKVKMYASKGEEYEVRSLLFSLMLESHNDSAVVLAEHVGKQFLSEDLKSKSVAEYTIQESKQAVKAFAKLMNDKAKELGCENTWFITPNGLDATESITVNDGDTLQKEHCTTAAELARIMTYCIKESPGRDLFLEITGTQNYSFYENNRNVNCVNHNTFLSMMEGAFSGKTGFTNKAGYCYVGAVRQDGKTLIAVLLGCGWPNHRDYKWSDTRVLMNYGLSHYVLRDLNDPKYLFDEKRLEPIRVEGGVSEVLGDEVKVPVVIWERHDEELASTRKDLKMLMREDEKISIEYEMKENLKAPVSCGVQVGTILYSVDGKTFRTETIITAREIKKVEFPWCFRQILTRFILS